MVDIRKILIIFVVGILFAVLVFAVIEAVYPQPKYDDFCSISKFERSPALIAPGSCALIEIDPGDQDACNAEGGYISYNYDSRGCATDYYCETCSKDYDKAQEGYHRVVFYVSAILALIAIFVGLFLPADGNALNEWIGTGFMLGGAFALFFGTMTSYMHLDRIIRPIVIFLELVLVIFISYKKAGNLKKK